MKSQLKIPETIITYDPNYKELSQAMFCDSKTLGAKLIDCLKKDKNLVSALMSGVEQCTLNMQDVFFMAACFYSDTIQQMIKEAIKDE